LEEQVYTYALVKALYDIGEDHLESFWPFVINVFPPNNEPIGVEYIQSQLKGIYDLQIPTHTLRAVLNRAEKKAYIKKEKKKYSITNKGYKYWQSLDTDKEVKRSLNALFEDIKIFFYEQFETSLEIDEIKRFLLSFIKKNIVSIALCLNINISNTVKLQKPTIYDKQLVTYIKHIEHEKPYQYDIFNNVVLGSILSSVMSYKNISQIRKKFGHCQLYLDSNFLFSVLGLHSPELSTPAKEVFELLKKQSEFTIKVFSFTIDEMAYLIGGYIKYKNRYPANVRVNTIYTNLKRLGWTIEDAREFIVTIEDKISDLGIEVERVKDFDNQNYNPPGDLIGKIMKYRPLQPPHSRNHDLAAIEQIKKIRKHERRKIEDATALFLTSDIKLSKFDYVEMGHRDNGTICEVIVDQLLTNILWLKNPNISPDIPLECLIACYSRSMFVQRGIWERFFKIVGEMEKEGKVKAENVSMLFYHHYIEDVLSNFDESEADIISDDFIITEIEKAPKVIEEMAKKELDEMKVEFEKMLDNELHKKDEDFQKLLKELKEVKKNVRKRAEKSANRYSIALSSFLTLLLLGAIYEIYLILEKMGFSLIFILFVPLLIGSGGIYGIWRKLREYLTNTLSEYNMKRFKKAGLHEA